MTETQRKRQVKRYESAADRVAAKQGWTSSAVAHIDSALRSITQAAACANYGYGGVVASVNIRQVAEQARFSLRQLRRWCREMDNNQQSLINRFHAKARRLRAKASTRGL